MSVTLDKPTDAPEHDAESLYVSVTQTADGRVKSVRVSELEPYADETLFHNARTTVWTVELPEYSDTDTFHASKTLDLAHTSGYQHQDPTGWVQGERIAGAFYAHNSPERAQLRTVEAHLTRAGFLDAYTGMVMCQGYGLTLISGGEEYYAFRARDAWRYAMRDHHSYDGWYEFPGTLAPDNASPRRVAAAILARLVDTGGIKPAELSPLWRVRAHLGVLRITPHWTNFKFRARQRLDRYRHRITDRIPR